MVGPAKSNLDDITLLLYKDEKNHVTKAEVKYKEGFFEKKMSKAEHLTGEKALQWLLVNQDYKNHEKTSKLKAVDVTLPEDQKSANIINDIIKKYIRQNFSVFKSREYEPHPGGLTFTNIREEYLKSRLPDNNKG